MVFFDLLLSFFWLRSYFTKDLSQEFFSSATQLQVDGTQDTRWYKWTITSWMSEFEALKPSRKPMTCRRSGAVIPSPWRTRNCPSLWGRTDFKVSIQEDARSTRRNMNHQEAIMIIMDLYNMIQFNMIWYDPNIRFRLFPCSTASFATTGWIYSKEAGESKWMHPWEPCLTEGHCASWLYIKLMYQRFDQNCTSP